MSCQACGSPLITIIPDQLMRCPTCLLYKRIRTVEQPQIKGLPQTKVSTGNELGEEQVLFIDRVVGKLTSSPTNPNWKAPKPVRDKVRYELLQVLSGKTNFDKWFLKTRQNFNLRNYELAQILYDSLAGLRSREAQQLREQWLQFIQKEKAGYGL